MRTKPLIKHSGSQHFIPRCGKLMEQLMSGHGKKPHCRVNAKPRLCHFIAKGENRNQLFAYAGGKKQRPLFQEKNRPDN